MKLKLTGLGVVALLLSACSPAIDTQVEVRGCGLGDAGYTLHMSSYDGGFADTLEFGDGIATKSSAEIYVWFWIEGLPNGIGAQWSGTRGASANEQSARPASVPANARVGDGWDDDETTVAVKVEVNCEQAATADTEPAPIDTTAAATTTPPAPTPDGTWSLAIDPDKHDVCGDEDPYSETIKVALTETAAEVSGIGGSVADPWVGSYDETSGELTFAGTKREGDGTTEATFTLTFDPSSDTMSGTESWDYTEPGFTCTEATSVVTAKRE